MSDEQEIDRIRREYVSLVEDAERQRDQSIARAQQVKMQEEARLHRDVVARSLEVYDELKAELESRLASVTRAAEQTRAQINSKFATASSRAEQECHQVVSMALQKRTEAVSALFRVPEGAIQTDEERVQ